VVQQFRELEYNVSLLPKMKIEIVVNDDLQRCMVAVADAARTGEVGDGKILVSTIDDVLRIRTGESGTEAVWHSGRESPLSPPLSRPRLPRAAGVSPCLQERAVRLVTRSRPRRNIRRRASR
jgi:hypothetical protein